MAIVNTVDFFLFRHRNLPNARSSASDRCKLLVSATAVFALLLQSCATMPPALRVTSRMVRSPRDGQLLVSASAAPPIGDVLPIWISATNDTSTAYQVSPEQVFAIDEKTNRNLPLPPEVVASRHRSVNEGLMEAFVATAVAAAIGGSVGTGLAAGAPAFFAAGMGAGMGAAFSGAWVAENSTDATVRKRIRAFALRHGILRQSFTQAGYVYFVSGSYRGIEVVLIDSLTLEARVVEVPLR